MFIPLMKNDCSGKIASLQFAIVTHNVKKAL